MAKGHKSSATAGTRKKNARKAAETAGQPASSPVSAAKLPKNTKGSKRELREARQREKVYIPPVKPAPPKLDPLDTTGLARILPPDLVVVLRSLGKKDAVTKTKALEELSKWVDDAAKEPSDVADEGYDGGQKINVIVEMLPVWLHRIPVLFTHPARRVRFLAGSLQTALVRLPPTRSALIRWIADQASQSELVTVLGVWVMLAHDVDRGVANVGERGLTEFVGSSPNLASPLPCVTLTSPVLSDLLTFSYRAVLDPAGLHASLNPIAAPIDPIAYITSGKGAKGKKGAPVTPTSDPAKAGDAPGEESEADRSGRLRASALGAVRWIIGTSMEDTTEVPLLQPVSPHLSSPNFWSSLHPGPTCPFTLPEDSTRTSDNDGSGVRLKACLGHSQPQVRRAAWALVASLLEGKKGPLPPDILHILSSAILRSAWVETDAGVRVVLTKPLLMFLKGVPRSTTPNYPWAWTIDAERAMNNYGDIEIAEEVSVDEPEDEAERTDEDDSTDEDEDDQTLPSPAFWSMAEGYPLVLVFPRSLTYTHSSQLLDALWAPFYARLLPERRATAAWLRALLECMVCLVKQALEDLEPEYVADEKRLVRPLLERQFSALWDALSTRTLRIDAVEASRTIATTLDRLAKIGEDLFKSAFTAIAVKITKGEEQSLSLAPTFLCVFNDTFAPGHSTKAALHEEKGAKEVVAKVEPLIHLMDTFGSRLFEDDEFASVPVQTSSLPGHLRGVSYSMDTLILKWLDYSVEHSSEPVALDIVNNILSVYSYFISPQGLAAITDALSRNVTSYAETMLDVAGVSPFGMNGTADLSATSATRALSLARRLIDAGYQMAGEKAAELYVGVALLAFIVPSSNGEDDGNTEGVDDARVIWESLVTKKHDGEGTEEMRQAVSALLKEQLRKNVVNSRILSRPDHIMRALLPGIPGLQIDVLIDILPSRSDLDVLLEDLPGTAVSPSLALIDATIPTTPSSEDTSYYPIANPGDALILPLHPYGRAVFALLTYLSSVRTKALVHLWALRHVITFGVYLAEYVHVGDERSPVFGGTLDARPGKDAIALAKREIARDLLGKAQALVTYLLSRAKEDIHARAVGALLKDDSGVEEGSFASFVVEVVRKSVEGDTVRDALVLRTVLQHLFVDATKDDADLWLVLARRFEKTAPQTAIAILVSITVYAPEPPKLDRYRNELAATLLGVKPEDAETTGLKYLRLLSASAPDPNSAVVFLPQHRAVNVMRACQTWIAEGDEDASEELESVMTLVFRHVAPILENVPGSHWEFIWDVVESNLEVCSLEEPDTLATLGRTLQLVTTIEELVTTNKSLREGWEKRRKAIFGLIKKVVIVDTREISYSDPRAICRELAMSIVQNMPSSMIDEKTLATMCHLLADNSPDVQRMSYHLLQSAASKFTEHLVVEAGVDTEGTVKSELPEELLAILQQGIGEGFDEDLPSSRSLEVSGYLLAWMVIFDLFTGASLKVRSGYFNHLRSLDIVSEHFIPSIFDVLGLLDGKKVFKLDMWSVDEFYLDAYDPADSLSLQLLAAHLYHRALLTIPALIRSWISDRTDKQLLMRISDYTSAHFSPGIIKAELTLIRHPPESSELSTTENLNIKVSSAFNEVAASYSVDEQVLELSIRMPNDWPLRRLEVRDTKKVGVSEEKWKAWVLGVQQIVWQQNGRIVDGLTLFAKNVTLHFAGQVECAICYSIISVMDASLPQKPCRTCKNRFHASCLYKHLILQNLHAPIVLWSSYYNKGKDTSTKALVIADKDKDHIPERESSRITLSSSNTKNHLCPSNCASCGTLEYLRVYAWEIALRSQVVYHRPICMGDLSANGMIDHPEDVPDGDSSGGIFIISEFDIDRPLWNCIMNDPHLRDRRGRRSLTKLTLRNQNELFCGEDPHWRKGWRRQVKVEIAQGRISVQKRM
ncbi:hypothetical protein F5J12DRAFT_785457 [Pisolithus orientalis]|uniref:uncharacterized protein n=1 Tax=Pisolithus orientalis TaxID=936130 RepID=UPI002224D55F|nr:uncharacterized protein F5J12DRAFT_785457 [Pisolithus orientalis]KAI5996508.1 hypothetical protein F5J12DRAFT_785457 [Pisolithus orientalis]